MTEVVAAPTLFNSIITDGVPGLLEYNDLKWITHAEILNYNFCPADKEFSMRTIILF